MSFACEVVGYNSSKLRTMEIAETETPSDLIMAGDGMKLELPVISSPTLPCPTMLGTAADTKMGGTRIGFRNRGAMRIA